MYCKKCNKETSNPQFCSISCSAKFHNNIRPKKNLAPKPSCLHCGKESNYRNSSFCSQQCYGFYREELNLQKIITSGIIHPKGFYHSSNIARKILTKLHGYKCSICHLSNWQGKQITLINDHINGIPDDWRIENLRLLCPNCDSQTDTYKGKNKGKGRPQRRVTVPTLGVEPNSFPLQGNAE